MSTTQRTEGWCSPAIAGVKGKVTINCTGVDPKVVKRLNEFLDEKDNELGKARRSLDEKIQEANEWIKKYKETEARLDEAGETNELAKRAKALLDQGELEQAGHLI